MVVEVLFGGDVEVGVVIYELVFGVVVDCVVGGGFE